MAPAEAALLDPEEVAAGIRIVFDDDGSLTVADGVIEVTADDGSTVYRWRCQVCGYIHEGPEAPRWCPLCGADRDQFVPEAAAAGAHGPIPTGDGLVWGGLERGGDAAPGGAAGGDRSGRRGLPGRAGRRAGRPGRG